MLQLLERIAAALPDTRELSALSCTCKRLKTAVKAAAVSVALHPQHKPAYDDMRAASERCLQGVASSLPGGQKLLAVSSSTCGSPPTKAWAQALSVSTSVGTPWRTARCCCA